METPVAIPKASSDPLPELDEFLEPFAPLFRRVQSRQSLERYITGLLTDLPRKNCDTIAAAVAGTSTERLQHLLTDAEWDARRLDALRVGALSEKSPGEGVLLLDDTSFAKQGKSSVGVARQYCGALGKRANCQVVVSAQYVADEPGSRTPLHWPVSGRLYLPEEEWARDPGRRERAHVPEEVDFGTKPRLALDLVDLANGWEVPFAVVVADSGYGRNPEFLKGLEERSLPYVCGVERTFGVRRPEEVEAAEAAGAPAYQGMGQPPKARPAALYTAEEAIASLPEEEWELVSWREGTKGTLGKEMVAKRVHRGIGSPRYYTNSSGHVVTSAEGWLLAERPPGGGTEGERKYYFAMLGADTPLKRLGELAHSRWAIEQFYEDAKGECGLGDFQGRRWDGFHRHLSLSMLAYSFLMAQSSEEADKEPSWEEGFSPLASDQTDHAPGDPPASARVATGGSGVVVHRDRTDKELPPSSNLTK